jgi:hypothetical protein
MNGLAQQGMQSQIDPAMIQQIIALIKQGITPEELIAQGVPQELIAIAMEQIQIEAQTVNSGGLAAQGARNVQMAV